MADGVVEEIFDRLEQRCFETMMSAVMPYVERLELINPREFIPRVGPLIEEHQAEFRREMRAIAVPLYQRELNDWLKDFARDGLPPAWQDRLQEHLDWLKERTRLVFPQG